VPLKPIKRKCKKSDGKRGKAVVVKVSKKGKKTKTKQRSCHSSLRLAKAAIRAYYANKNEAGKVSVNKEQLHEMIISELYSDDLLLHVLSGVGVDQNIHRPGSDAFFALFREARLLSESGLYKLNEEEADLLEGTDLGTFGFYNGVLVPLDFPMLYENDDILEAKYKGRKVKLGKKGVQRIGGGKARVYVRDPKTGKVKKVEFGSSMPDAMGSSKKHKARRKSYGKRHRCADKKDKTKPGYWSCRLTKLFGRNIAGWW
jgi:hypothetical protein